MNIYRKHEKGQIVVLLALAIVGLLGFTALAIDVGMVFSDRRYAQNAADASALAGAQASSKMIETIGMKNYEWNCSTLNANISASYSAGIARAGTNDFVIAQDADLGTPGHDHGIKITCNQAGKYLDVFVMLSRVTSTSFAQLFYGGQMRNTVSSITRVWPGVPAGNGSNLVSLSKDCGNNIGGILFSGNTEVSIRGTWSNSCIEAKSNTDVTVSPGSVDYHAGSYAVGFTNPVPVPHTEYHPMTDATLPSPGAKCASASIDPYNDLKNAQGTIDPGNYRDWDFKGDVVLNPGLYCVSGTVSMNSNVGLTGNGITIFYTGTSFTINGKQNGTLAAPNSPSNPPVNNAVEDLLIYTPKGTAADIKINGTSGSYIGGTIYAPSSLVFIAGNATAADPMTMTSSIIGYDIDLTGTSYLSMTYDEDKDYGWPSNLDQNK